MIVNIFIHSKLNLPQLAKALFSLLGFDSKDILLGQSTYSINDTYYFVSFAGLELKIDENNYDYEDEYNFHLSIKKDVLKGVVVDESIIQSVSKLMISLILNNMEVDKLAIENENFELQVLKN